MFKKSGIVFVFLVMFVFLPGCLGGLMEVYCSFLSNNTHCYQKAAVMQNDPEVCKKVSQPEEWKKAGSNPPKDKCYLMIAENTSDKRVCENIVGGIGSYTKEECYRAVDAKK